MFYLFNIQLHTDVVDVGEQVLQNEIQQLFITDVVKSSKNQ